MTSSRKFESSVRVTSYMSLSVSRTVTSEKPIHDTVKEAEDNGTLNVNFPSMSVEVPTVVPGTITLAPGTGSDVALTTVPLTVLF